MFVSDSHLPQLLAPEAYRSVEQHDREFERLFARGWHMVCTTADLPRDGDYVTLRLGSIPLLVRRCGGDVRTFLNVCAHRYCELTSSPRGHDPAFACQYHGWEYDESGNTRRIPDAPSFKPLQKGMLCLTSYRTALCGQLVFVSLDPEGPDLAAFLGESHAVYARLFSDRYEQVVAWDRECDANWKVGVENGLESYHVSCVHAGTFGVTPDAADCHHELRDDHTVFRTPASQPGSWLAAAEEAFATGIGDTPTHDYMNLRTYPSLTCSRTDTVTFVQSILPLGPTRSVHIYRLFMPRVGSGSVWNRLTHWWWRPRLAAYWRAVFAEDHVILPRIQNGLNSPMVPRGGVVSAREERIFHFQRYVADHCGGGVEATPAAAAAGEMRR
jgi:phenylpropionate dioxygenase-like ring-hydroxylating dioxygenase large terminal subunit